MLVERAQTGAHVDESAGLVTALYEALIERSPTEGELAYWRRNFGGLSAADLVRRFVEAPAYQRRRGVPAFFPAGHYHSPIVDPTSVGSYVERVRENGPHELHGIDIDDAAMRRLFEAEAGRLSALELPVTAVPERRYFSDKSPFPPGDAASLYLMMSLHRPRRIVEIGSGSSTAAALDFAELLGLSPFFIRCIEPYPHRLKAMLRPGDEASVEIRETFVQNVTAEEIVADLSPGDIFFIDSTHVLKTGSDVHHEIFNLLPRIPPGVIIHVHDVPFPFEYSDFWVFERNYSWNEAYALQAFLMFNVEFKIIWWASMLKTQMGAHMGAAGSHFATNAGSSVWLQRVR